MSIPGYDHLCETFAQTERTFPDLMEPYAIRLGDAETADERMLIMQAGLRETFKQREPMAEPRTLVAVDDRQGALSI